jgi:hypothetical protein
MSIEGFVPLSSYDDRRDDSGHSAAWKALREAIKAGEVEGYQRGGSNRWIVHKEQADRYLSRTQRERRVAAEKPASDDLLAGIAVTLVEILTTLREINSSIPPRGDSQ